MKEHAGACWESRPAGRTDCLVGLADWRQDLLPPKDLKKWGGTMQLLEVEVLCVVGGKGGWCPAKL